MKRRIWFALPLLGALVLVLGLLSTAQADRQDAAPVATGAQATDKQCTATDSASPRAALLPGETASAAPTSPLAALLPTATAMAGETASACPAGYAWTCCWCGCGCRKITISPTNFCRFYWCPGP